MYRLIDLDQTGKEAESYVFLVSLGGEKVGFSDVEVAEMLRARPTNKPKKASSGKVKGAAAMDVETSEITEQLSPESSQAVSVQ